ncbi:hypothetical protein OIU85_008641 [Salix viminalis]|uniref:Uncharacterized protein n=1 Tax=Salix viminalis TaxID=40686 RepID=A0A9Q0NY24_SALVM|nr:hypothetical protein OIU85_008641 [Salix viminalis]
MSLFSDSPHIYFGKKYVELHRQSVARSTNQRFFYSGGQKSEGCISHLNNINHVVGNNYILLHNICQKLGIKNNLHKTPVELLPTRYVPETDNGLKSLLQNSNSQLEEVKQKIDMMEKNLNSIEQKLSEFSLDKFQEKLQSLDMAKIKQILEHVTSIDNKL